MIDKIKLFLLFIIIFNYQLFSQENNLSVEDSIAVEDSIIIKENSGFNLGITSSAGLVNGKFITNTPVGASMVITTPWGFSLGEDMVDFDLSLVFGFYTGKSGAGTEMDPEKSFNPLVFGIGGNATLFQIIFSETHIGNVGAGLGLRSFAGVTLERLLQGKDLNLPINILMGAEGFISTSPEDGRNESSYWGGIGARIDYSF